MPGNARPILKIEIAEHDRGFLRVGQGVQMTFNAFPCQRYGLIRGTLQTIWPATKPSLATTQPVHEGGRRSTTPGRRWARPLILRHGMTAAAERRLIDLAPDPFRDIGG